MKDAGAPPAEDGGSSVITGFLELSTSGSHLFCIFKILNQLPPA
jgi:hypothetical protein